MVHELKPNLSIGKLVTITSVDVETIRNALQLALAVGPDAYDAVVVALVTLNEAEAYSDKMDRQK